VIKKGERPNDLTVSPSAEPISIDSVFPRLEDAILSVLVTYEGKYEETLLDWYLALRLIEPELVHPRQLISVFERLSEAGFVQFIRHDVLYTGCDEIFFLGKPFTTVLSTEGLVQPSTLKS
jgi:hypothetical protein